MTVSRAGKRSVIVKKFTPDVRTLQVLSAPSLDRGLSKHFLGPVCVPRATVVGAAAELVASFFSGSVVPLGRWMLMPVEHQIRK